MNFFIVGAPKCGTTTLFEWFGRHRHIHMPHKEPCFFSQDIFATDRLATHIPTLDAYLDLCAAAPGSGLTSGEATPKYLYSDRALTEIRHLWPDARIIVCLRDPADLVVSYHNQKLREGEESEPDFARAWQRGLGPQPVAHDASRPEIGGRINYLFWARFGVRLQKLHAQFPAGQIRIVLLAELKSAPRATYRALLGFLGLDDDGREDFASANERVRIRNLALHRGVLAVKRASEPVRQALLGTQGTGALKALHRFNTQAGQYTSSPPPLLRRRIHEVLEDDIRLAERYLDGRRLIAAGNATP